MARGPQSVHKFLYSEFLAGSGRRLRLLTGARPRASGVPTACMRCARRGDGIPSPSVRRAQAPAALAPRGPSVQPEGLAACRAVRAPMRSAHGERLRRPEPTVSEAARGAAQSACSQISAPVLNCTHTAHDMHAYSTRQPPAAAFRHGQQAVVRSEQPSNIIKSTAGPSACLAEAAGAHELRWPASMAGPGDRRGARAGALGRARPPLCALLALLAGRSAVLRRWAVAGRHILLRIRALQNLSFCRLRGRRRCSQSTQGPSPPLHLQTSAKLAVGQSTRTGASTAPGASDPVQDMTQVHRRRRGAGGEARGGAVGQRRPASGRAGSLWALDARAAERHEGRALDGQRPEADGLQRHRPRLLRRNIGWVSTATVPLLLAPCSCGARGHS